MKYMIYRINNTTGTFTLPAGGTGLIEAKASGDVNVPSSWVPRLKSTFASANDGTVSTNSAIVENKFPFPILGGKIRFVVPKGSSYAATNGVVSQEFDGEKVHVVDVSFDAAANSSTTVYIAAGEPIDLCPNDPNKLVPGNCGCGVPEGTCAVPVTGVSLSSSLVKLNLNVTKQLTATISPTTATNKNINWQSNNTAVATVSSDGFVTAVGGGTATITVTTEDGAKVASVNVIVNPSTTLYPAEDADLVGVLAVANQPGYNGDGFADFTNLTNDYIKWTVYAPVDGNYSLSFRYSLASNSRPLKLSVNGAVKIPSIDFPITGSWANWSNYTTIQPLDAGNNTIMLTAIGSSGGNFDELVMSNGPTGLKDLYSTVQEPSIQVCPNPFQQGKLSIHLTGFENQSNMKLNICNTLGQTMYEQTISSGKEEISMPTDLTEAIYIIAVQSEQQKAVTRLIVK